MQQTSAAWKALWAAGNARLESAAVIGGHEYREITAPVISRGLMQGGLSIGNAVSASCQLAVRTEASIPRGAEVQIKMRLSDGQSASEWLPAGTFYISHRSRDGVSGLVALECYDALLKANAPVPGGLSYPMPMADMATALAAALGVGIDPRTRIATGAVYVVPEPEEGTTIHDVLCLIAAANAGSWIVTPAGLLRLVPLASAEDAAQAAEVVEAVAVLGGIAAGEAGSVTGIRYGSDGGDVLLGDATGLVLDVGVPAEIATLLYDRLLGLRYRAYSLQGAVYDPAAEPGDFLRAGSGGEVESVLCVETAALGPLFRGDISAPEAGEMSDEYPYIGASARALQAAKVYAAKAVAGLDAALDQQSIFDRLTGGGAAQGLYLADGRLYINGTYMQMGTIRGADGRNYWILDGDSAQFVANKGRIGSFTLDNGALIYGTPGEDGNGIRMRYDGFLTSYGGSSSGIVGYSWLHNGWLDIGNYGYGSVKLNAPSAYNGGFSISCTNADGSFTRVPMYCDNSDANRRIVFGGPYKTQFQNDVTVGQGTLTAQTLNVTGTKSRVVDAGQYSRRLLYCYETPSPMFGDVGEGEIGADGRCYVWLDPVFARTVSTEGYQVFLQRYGAGDCRVAERRPGCFVVEGEPGLRFGWEIKAKQRDFDQRRLDPAEAAYVPEATDYGELAAAHIDNIRKEREST